MDHELLQALAGKFAEDGEKVYEIVSLHPFANGQAGQDTCVVLRGSIGDMRVIVLSDLFDVDYWNLWLERGSAEKAVKKEG